MANQQKVSQRKNVDGISGLPDCVLHHLLSFLPTEYVVQTCALSKKWRDVWCSIPSLHFNQLVRGKRSTSFTKFVDNVLFLRHGSDIEKLHLHYTATSSRERSCVNDWMVFAVKRKIQCLNIVLINRSDEPFHFPYRFFNCETLRQLKLTVYLKGCRFPASVCLPSLESLHLKFVFADREKLTNALISSCPVLQNLIIECSSLDEEEVLIILAQQLKRLVVRSPGGTYGIKVDAPSLESLEVDVGSLSEGSVFANLNSLNNVKLSSTKLSLSLAKILEELENACSISLSSSYVQACAQVLVMETQVPRCLATTFSNLKWLVLGAGYSDAAYFVINILLVNTPNVETFLLKTSAESVSKENFSVDIWSDSSLSQLKMVKIQNFGGRDKEIELVKWLLRNAPILQKLTVVAATSLKKTKFMEIGEMLLAYSRASSCLGILFM